MTVATKTLVAYHGDAALKASVLAQMAEHRKQDQIAQGFYWRNGDGKPFRGCAVGCLTHDPEGGHHLYEANWGIPEVLAHLEDSLFESLPVDQAQLWPERFLDAIPVGAHLTNVWPRFAVWLMIDEKWGVANATDKDDIKHVCGEVARGYQARIDGVPLSATDEDVITAAVRAAWAVRDAWAVRAVRDAWAAWAAWDARAAWAARAARDAWAARAARAAFVTASCDKLIDLLETV